MPLKSRVNPCCIAQARVEIAQLIWSLTLHCWLGECKVSVYEIQQIQGGLGILKKDKHS
tara:strand:+ start:698 stop:874 length:177 start_codon:yes stop_codon:yes gene_type:complete